MHDSGYDNDDAMGSPRLTGRVGAVSSKHDKPGEKPGFFASLVAGLLVGLAFAGLKD